MAAAGTAFITPHALHQFQRRIARLPDGQARAVILRGIAHPLALRMGKRQDGVPVLDLAIDGEYRFICTVIPSSNPELLPAVVTVIPATVGRDRPNRLKWERPGWMRLC